MVALALSDFADLRRQIHGRLTPGADHGDYVLGALTALGWVCGEPNYVGPVTRRAETPVTAAMVQAEFLAATFVVSGDTRLLAKAAELPCEPVRPLPFSAEWASGAAWALGLVVESLP